MGRGEAGEIGRLRQLRRLSLELGQACAVADIVDLLAGRLSADCDAQTAVVYLLDPDQPDVLRLAASRGAPSGRLDPGLLCQEGGALIARAVQERQPITEVDRSQPDEPVSIVACPLMLRGQALGAFAFGWTGPWPLDAANLEFLLGASALVALALDRTAATEKACEAQRVSDHMTVLVGRIFGGQSAKAPA